MLKRLIERALEEVPVQSMPGIKDSYLVEKKIPNSDQVQFIIQTEGVNFCLLWQYADQL